MRIGNADFEPGCYADSARGWRGVVRPIELAEEAGLIDLSAHERRALVLHAQDRPTAAGVVDGNWAMVYSLREIVMDHVREMSQAAEDDLNAATPPGALWGWEDGEFLLMADDSVLSGTEDDHGVTSAQGWVGGADLSGAALGGTDLSGADLSGADLRGE